MRKTILINEESILSWGQSRPSFCIGLRALEEQITVKIKKIVLI